MPPPSLWERLGDGEGGGGGGVRGLPDPPDGNGSSATSAGSTHGKSLGAKGDMG